MENIILPAVVLGIRPLAVVIQLMRNSLLETFGQDYIPARAKGLSEFQIIRKHALKLQTQSLLQFQEFCFHACRCFC
jgi:peptide/nickel transport system permease protein